MASSGRKPVSDLTPSALREWRHRLKLNQVEAAEALGHKARQIATYETRGDEAIPRKVVLAMRALEEHPDWVTVPTADLLPTAAAGD